MGLYSICHLLSYASVLFSNESLFATGYNASLIFGVLGGMLAGYRDRRASQLRSASR